MDTKTNLSFLDQFVTGKPKRIVEHYLLIGADNAYKKAKALLHERCGNCNVIRTAFIEKLEKWSKVNQKDHSALRDFSDFLEKIIAARETIPSLAFLDFAKENMKLLAKLPYHLENKWRDHIKQWRVSHGEISYPPFKVDMK